jgi:hypothetical protein
MTKAERRVKKYVDAWCDGKRVQTVWYSRNKHYWEDVADIFQLLRVFHNGWALRIVRGKRT